MRWSKPLSANRSRSWPVKVTRTKLSLSFVTRRTSAGKKRHGGATWVKGASRNRYG
jgi:hypothetical protein